MPSTRSSSRIGGSNQTSSDPPKPSPPQKSSANGTKRKADSSSGTGAEPQKKTGRKPGRPKKQKTIEETMPDAEDGGEKDEEEDTEMKEGGVDDEDMKDAAEEGEEEKKDEQGGEDEKEEGEGKDKDSEDKGENKDNGENNEHKGVNPPKSDLPASETNGVQDKNKDEEPTAEAAAVGDGEANDKTKFEDQPEASGEKLPFDDEKDIHGASTHNDKSAEKRDESKAEVSTNKAEPEKKEDTTNGAVSESTERASAMPSSILEKGIIYFFIRGRVGVDSVDGVQDIARTYIVLRPLPAGASLKSGTLPDEKNNRMLALPKKVLPKSGRDQFMTFVESPGATIAEFKESFMKGSDYETKTTGVRHTHAVTPVGEGVYALTSTNGGRETHLAYMLTIPSEIGEVQKSLGLEEKGSFVVSLKNPEAKGPSYANLPQGADFSKEIMEEFRGRRWMPARPEHLNYANAQVLLIGEAQGELGKAAEGEEGKGGKTAEEEMEKLEEEDTQRVEGLKGEEAEAVFADLGISRKEYPELMTTW